MLHRRVVHFTHCDVIKCIILSYSSYKYKAQCRAVFTVFTVDTGSTSNVTPRELQLHENYRLCENEYSYQLPRTIE